MKLTGKQVDGFLARPDPAQRAVLVYGPDGGLRRERINQLRAGVVDDPGDPFCVSELSAAQIKEDPARLSDEAAALTFGGGRRFVLVRDAADAMTATVKDFLERAPGEALVVFDGGDLPGRSSLRRAFEGDKSAVAIACYHDDQRSVAAVVRDFFAEAGLLIEREAVDFLAGHLGGDRQLTRRELEKLLLFKGLESGPLTAEDAEHCVGDSALLSLDDVALATASGNLAGLERALSRCFSEGNAPVSLLRAVARHFQRIHQVAGAVAAGTAVEQAMKGLRPPVFWKSAASFKAQASAWPGAALAVAMNKLLEAEAACKRSGAPAETLTARALMEIAANAPGRRAARR
ncbi:DNA polymerase III subunit delta [Pelagibius litoralis]|uniref:DNA-directed DNA polymerase n=1 Tax=Pelagibius litoralis TaxID=374515 RepID=A0A967F248_9PROT|nr:DNA polymerase III subunit delta [Pelagibius litoralis]NIA71690.1 DNA polymerase III subunit delta [Pelagibius litoralis]